VAGRRANDRVDDELRDPERGDRNERPHEPEQDHRGRVRAVRLPDEREELGQVSQNLDLFAPGRGSFFRLHSHPGNLTPCKRNSPSRQYDR
jgi:hypothetical protein